MLRRVVTAAGVVTRVDVVVAVVTGEVSVAEIVRIGVVVVTGCSSPLPLPLPSGSSLKLPVVRSGSDVVAVDAVPSSVDSTVGVSVGVSDVGSSPKPPLPLADVTVDVVAEVVCASVVAATDGVVVVGLVCELGSVVLDGSLSPPLPLSVSPLPTVVVSGTGVDKSPNVSLVGAAVGEVVGDDVGLCVSGTVVDKSPNVSLVGGDVGLAVGSDVGGSVGGGDGFKVGNPVGRAVGTSVGFRVGESVGASLGATVR